MDIYTAPSTPPPRPYAPLTHHSFLYAVSRPCSRHRGELNTQIQKLMPKPCRLGFIYPFPTRNHSFPPPLQWAFALSKDESYPYILPLEDPRDSRHENSSWSPPGPSLFYPDILWLPTPAQLHSRGQIDGESEPYSLVAVGDP